MRGGAAFVVAAVVLALAVPAAAKNGAWARLLAPLPRRAVPGKVITVRWTVEVRDAGGKAIPFGAAPMFVELTGRTGASTTGWALRHGPPYAARVRVPEGGIARIRVGLLGWSSTPTGNHPAPVYFRITNDPFRP
jgi:hypothetical protein